jgi:hypothetical protein
MEGSWEVFDIQVALKIIKHISAGIYRTPGGIIKELVNNSYDAGATLVQITSGHPSHSFLKIKDNGDGMTKDSLEFSFMHVGASQKVLDEDYPSPYGRKIIGMFGIGMLAAVHASPHIVLRTFPKDENYGVEAILDLRPYFEYINEIKTLEEFKFGTIKYKLIPRDQNDRGTEIILDQVDNKSNFYKAITRKTKKGQDFVKWPSDPSSTDDKGEIMGQFVHNLDEGGIGNIEDLSGREQFLWELGLICPVEYLSEGPIKEDFLFGESKKIIQKIKEDLESLNFKVYFDGVQLRKPIILPSTKLRTSELDALDQDSGKDVKISPISIDLKIPDTAKDNKIVATGYVIHQPHRVTPLQLMGLYPRVKYVGVGRYDNNFFRVIHGEKPILRAQLSGEIYISEGLDNALNLDREGFIEIDAGFQTLREALIGIIQDNPNSVVKQAKKSGDARRERRLKLKKHKIKVKLEEEVKTTLKDVMPGKEVEFKEPTLDKKVEKAREYSSVAINSDGSKVQISLSDLRIQDARTISLIIKLDEVLSSKPEFNELREEFRKIVNELFKDC